MSCLSPWGSGSIVGTGSEWQANSLEIIGKSLSHSTLNGVFNAVKVFQNIGKTVGLAVQYDSLRADAVEAEQLVLAVEWLSVRRLTLEHEKNVQYRDAEMIIHYNSLWKKWDAAYKSVSTKPEIWLRDALVKAGLSDDLSIVKE